MKLRNLLLGLSTTALVVSPMLVMTSCQQKEIVYAAIEVVSEKDTISATQTLQMDIKVSPTTISEKPEVTWSVDDDTLAYIDNSTGKLTAFSKTGKVTVTATLKANTQVKASKTINIVDFLITPTITCDTGMSAQANAFARGQDLIIKYSFSQGKIDIDQNNIEVNGNVLDPQKFDFKLDEDNQTLTIYSSVFTRITPISSTVSINLKTIQSEKIIPVINTATGLKDCTYNSVVGGRQLIINYNLESDYGIETADNIDAVITYSDSNIVYKKAKKIDKVNKTITIEIPAANEEITVTNVTVTITTCELWDTTDAINYIYNRTFSFGAGDSYGTMWILNPYDGNDLSSYQYYIATNWHVKSQLISSKEDYKIGNGKNATVSNYQTVRVIDWCDDDKMTYDGTIQKAIDLAVAHVDLSNAATQDANIKQQLDGLNTYYNQHGYITQITDTTSSEKHYESMPLYTAGFPLQASEGPKWEENTFNNGEVEYRGWDSTAVQHTWQTIKGQFACDISPMYTTKNPLAGKMAPGASGSMIIGNFGTNDKPYFKAVAIYFGGWSLEGEEGTHLSFSIFNNEEKNFLKDYI